MFDNVKLDWNDKEKTFVDRGVNVTTEGYGNPFCSGCTKGNNAFGALQYVLVKALKYPNYTEPEQSYFSTVLYDFRLGPRSWRNEIQKPAQSDYFTEHGDFVKLKNHIEKVFEMRNHRRVIISSISEGGTFIYLFLRWIDQEWKDTFILGWISLSTPFSGSTEIGLHLLSGDSAYSIFIPWLNARKFRDASSGWPGLVTLSLLPSGDTNSDRRVFVTSPSANYTMTEYAKALYAAKRNETLTIYDDVRSFLGNGTIGPGVNTYCLYGSHVSTVSRVSYLTSDLSDEPTVERDLIGDGTVHQASLEGCKRWESNGIHKTTVKSYFNVTHTNMLFDKEALTDFLQYTVEMLEMEDERRGRKYSTKKKYL
eukprot:g3602.t1